MDLSEIITSAKCKEDITELKLFATYDSGVYYLYDSSLHEAVSETNHKGVFDAYIEKLFSVRDDQFTYRTTIATFRSLFFEIIEDWCGNVVNSDKELTDYFLNDNAEVYVCSSEATEENFDDFILTKFRVSAEVQTVYDASEIE